jgi:hypothetical protein
MAVAWALLSKPRHRGAMTGSTVTSPRAAADADPGLLRRWLGGRYAKIALACGFLVIVLAVMHAGPPWASWVGSTVAFVTALAVLLAGELSWERTVATAQTTGLVAQRDCMIRLAVGRSTSVSAR